MLLLSIGSKRFWTHPNWFGQVRKKNPKRGVYYYENFFLNWPKLKSHFGPVQGPKSFHFYRITKYSFLHLFCMIGKNWSFFVILIVIRLVTGKMLQCPRPIFKFSNVNSLQNWTFSSEKTVLVISTFWKSLNRSCSLIAKSILQFTNQVIDTKA